MTNFIRNFLEKYLSFLEIVRVQTPSKITKNSSWQLIFVMLSCQREISLQEGVGWEAFTVIWGNRRGQTVAARSNKCAQNHKIGSGPFFSLKDCRTGPSSK